MSKFTESRTPYEFLVRWNQDSTISGAHVGFLDTVLKDGEVLTQKQNNVQSVALGLQEGFPLSDVLEQVLIDALLLIETLQSQNAGLKSEVETKDKEIAELEASATQAAKEIADLKEAATEKEAPQVDAVEM
jgi:TolA-binding protein